MEDNIVDIQYQDNPDGTKTAIAYDADGNIVSTETIHTPFYDPQRMKLMQQLPQENQ